MPDDGRPIAVDDAYCPRCLRALDRRAPPGMSTLERYQWLTTPQLLRCNSNDNPHHDCDWEGLVTLARRL